MYEFITHTWNTVKGACYHDCSYCYMKRRGRLNPVRFDQKELKEFDRDMIKYGEGQFIFVGSSCDMFANNILEEWIIDTIKHCDKYDNRYMFQTKNPKNIRRILTYQSHVCVTLETNRHYPEIMRNSPKPIERIEQMRLIRHPLYITIEPIMDFDLDIFVEMLKSCDPIQINIGADSGGNKLPEPDRGKLDELIAEIQKFTTIHNKRNLTKITN